MTLWQDLRYSLRSLGQNPALSATCFVVLALGIGANTTIFSAVKGILLDPLPYRDPGRLITLYERGITGWPRNPLSPANFLDWQRESKSFEDIAAYGDYGGSLSGDGTRLPEHIGGVLCSWNLFRTLGVQPELGRAFSPSDDSPRAHFTLILSDSLWKSRFGADPRVIGRAIRMDSVLYTVIGVMPPEGELPDAMTQFWVPMQQVIPPNEMQARSGHRLLGVGRLKPGVSLAQATAELSGIAARIKAQHPADLTGSAAEVDPLQKEMVGESVARALYVLWAAVGCVLLIACVNVANLLLTRSTARRRELAIRTALGASTGRLIRLLLLESMVLSLAGGLAGVMLAAWLTQGLIKIGTSLPRTSAIRLDWPTLLFAAAAALFAGVAAGALPALSASRLELNQAIHETSRSTFGSLRGSWYRSALVSGEIALSFLLLIAAGLLLKSFVLLENVNVGFRTDHLLTMRFDLPDAKYNDARRATYFEQLLVRVKALPGVNNAGLVSVMPVAGHYMDTEFTIVGRPPLPVGQFNDALPREADPGYFRAIGIPLKRGRFFTASERLQKANTTIISESFARHFFPNEDPIGKYLDFWDKKRQIVGIVGDVRKNLDQKPEPTMYAPISEGYLGFAYLVVRTSGDPLRLALPVEREMVRLDPDIGIARVMSMEKVISESAANQQFNAILLVSFAGLAVLLAAVGLYGVISYSTTQRIPEFGVRLALGAQPRDLIRSVVRQGLKPALLGMAAGALVTFAAVRSMESMLFEVQPFDATVFLCVGAGLFLISLAASFVPALRTTRIDPVEALRAE